MHKSLASFEAAWQQSFGATPPLGYALRQQHTERWFRIHSLPESKRYAESEREYEELLARHNAVAEDVFGDGAQVMLVCHTFSVPDESRPTLAPDLALGSGNEVRWFRRLEARELGTLVDPLENCAVDLWGLLTEWRRGAFDDAIRGVADDIGMRFLIATVDARRVYAPYDGGADLLVEDSVARDAMRRRYRGWLSEHPWGL
jgi:hypothetical protein